MALSPTLSDPCDGTLVLKDSTGKPIVISTTDCDFSLSDLIRDLTQAGHPNTSSGD